MTLTDSPSGGAPAAPAPADRAQTQSLAFRARGMHCHGCAHVIERTLAKLPGVARVKVDYPTETVTLVYDPQRAAPEAFHAAVAGLGYRPAALDAPERRGTALKTLGLLLALAGLLGIVFFDAAWIGAGGAPDISRHMSLELIFLLGLLTGFHCVGMCGGFVLSYAAQDMRQGRRSYASHLLYGAGKTLSYTSIGALFGLVGAVVAFTPLLRGLAGALAGAFLIAFGLNSLGLFASLRRLRLRAPESVRHYLESQSARPHRPFVVGLLNGLMIACGPLQAMYVMAAGTGSAIEGAKMLFAFALGTLPVLTGFGVLTTYLSGALTQRLLRLSGAIVVALGVAMINRGLILTGGGYDLASLVGNMFHAAPERSAPSQEGPPLGAAADAQVIRMEANKFGYAPKSFVLRRGVRTRWEIDGKDVTECNKRIVVPMLGLEFDVKPGIQVIEFTPDKAGVIPWSCWMGMLRGSFEVIDAPGEVAAKRPAAAEPAAAPAPAAAAPPKYRLQAGDTLAGVAAKLYGDKRRWRAIAAANPGLDPRRLRPGQEIKLPADGGGFESRFESPQ